MYTPILQMYLDVVDKTIVITFIWFVFFFLGDCAISHATDSKSPKCFYGRSTTFLMLILSKTSVLWTMQSSMFPYAKERFLTQKCISRYCYRTHF